MQDDDDVVETEILNFYKSSHKNKHNNWIEKTKLGAKVFTQAPAYN